MAVHYFFDRYSDIIKVIERIILSLLVPFFFVNIGLHFDLASIQADYIILPIVLVTSTVGQMLGTYFTKNLVKLSKISI